MKSPNDLFHITPVPSKRKGKKILTSQQGCGHVEGGKEISHGRVG